MTVAQLIEQLQKCQQDMPVYMFYDGAPRLSCNGAFIANDIYEMDDEYNDFQVTGLVLCETEDVYNSTAETKWLFKKELL